MQADKILKLVRLTEKSNQLSSKLGQYTFEVYGHATKDQINNAVLMNVKKKRMPPPQNSTPRRKKLHYHDRHRQYARP